MDEKEQFYITPEEKNIAIEFNNVTATWIPTSVDEVSFSLLVFVTFADANV